jgi:hypothetical protein
MKLNATFSKFLTNKLVLNIVSVIAFLNVIGFIVMDDLNSVIYFILLALLVTYFSKNMIIILGVPLILVNLFASRPQQKVKVEGMENNSDEESKKHQETINKLHEERRIDPNFAVLSTSTDNVPIGNTNTNDESFEVGRNKKKGGSYDIDYASTVEDAYDQLNKILGSDGIKRLTGDTQNLMKQQLQLAESMKSMTPIIQGMGPMLKQAQGILGGMGDGKEGLGNLLEIAKKFTGGATK